MRIADAFVRVSGTAVRCTAVDKAGLANRREFDYTRSL